MRNPGGALIAAALLGLLIGPPAVAGQADPISVPLSMTHGRLMVPVIGADGSEFNFILSTGNATTLLSESTAAALRAAGGGATMGGVAVPIEGAVTLPDARLTLNGQPLAGMIAVDLLSQFDVLLDVPNGRLLLKAPSARVQWAGVTLSRPNRMRVYHGVVLTADVQIGGEILSAMIDLGASPALIVNTPAGARLGVTDSGNRDLLIGDRTFAGLELSVQDLDVFARFDPSGGGFGMIGAGFAADCAISLSWIHQEIRTCTQ